MTIRERKRFRVKAYDGKSSSKYSMHSSTSLLDLPVQSAITPANFAAKRRSPTHSFLASTTVPNRLQAISRSVGTICRSDIEFNSSIARFKCGLASLIYRGLAFRNDLIRGSHVMVIVQAHCLQCQIETLVYAYPRLFQTAAD